MVRTTTTTGGVIIVINSTLTDAENLKELKELIEFMDEPDVRAATPARWSERFGEHRLGAVFIGPDLTDFELRAVVGGVGVLDRNIPIVMLHARA